MDIFCQNKQKSASFQNFQSKAAKISGISWMFTTELANGAFFLTHSFYHNAFFVVGIPIPDKAHN